ncbi:CoA transferase [uncultured Microbacterium sp.]|uniref:CoA transferase n=1 Tax=uncultured Microbacterium sp. TaxID=191216 RepID=UPI0028D13899|nr:CoA transferase [uncultured Microbacterium sp.]
MAEPTKDHPGDELLERVCSALRLDLTRTEVGARPPHPVPLPSRLATADLAWASVRSVCVAAGIEALPDPDRIAAAYRSDRVLTVDGRAPDVWSPYSGFFRAADGWIRTHGNYRHHAERLLVGLGLGPGASGDDVRAAVLTLSAGEAVALIAEAGGMAVRVMPEDPRLEARVRATPLLHVERVRGSQPASRSGGAARDPRAPLAGIRILDLTRVIAGPVCTRTLALLGADVLRVDPPLLPEPEWQHLDTGHGKRSTLLDARTDRMSELLATADVVVLGYRPDAVERLGLSARALLDRHPHLVVAQLSAWGVDQPTRGGFDSLVQAESGIAMVETADGDRPGVLPAQALDHSAGYLLAASIISLVERRRREGGGWIVRTSLRRVAAELLGMPRSSGPGTEREVDLTAHTVTFDIDGCTVTTAASALPGRELAAPHRWGSDQPRW